jgi:integrase
MAGRPQQPLGTYGSIRVYKAPGGYRARTLFRDWDGVNRAVERTGRSKAAAESALKLALRDRTHANSIEGITPETRVSDLADTWWDSIDLSPNTMQLYRYAIDFRIKPSLGGLRVRELTIGTVDRYLRSLAEKNGWSTAKSTRSVLSGMCGLAARHDALDRNPVRDIGRIPRPAKQAPRSLTLAEVRELRAKLAGDGQAVERDLPDYVSFMLATGTRIGEAAAITWDDIDLDTGAVDVHGTVVRIKGQGLVIRSTTKSRAGMRTLSLPRWCVDLLRSRRDELPIQSTVFPAPKGSLRDPSNTAEHLRQALDRAGFDWVTSHIFRKTVATLMDGAGLSSRAAADQLGHANPSMTQDVYMGRKVSSTGAADVLESIG